MAGRPGRDADVDPYARSAWRGKKPRPRGAAHILLARQAVEDADPGHVDLWRHRMWQRGKREQCSGKCSTIRHRAKSTAGTGRIGHGSATHQTANLCGKRNGASLPRPQGRAGALNLGDDSGRNEDLITTESTEITERKIRRREARPRRWMPLTDLPGIRSVISVLSVVRVVCVSVALRCPTSRFPGVS